MEHTNGAQVGFAFLLFIMFVYNMLQCRQDETQTKTTDNTYKCTNYAELINRFYGVDVSCDATGKHPLEICSKCYYDMQNRKRGSTASTSLQTDIVFLIVNMMLEKMFGNMLEISQLFE